jgi:hypothetical protein
MRVSLHRDRNRLVLSEAESGFREERALRSEDEQRFAGWAAAYRGIVGKDRNEEALRKLGREIHDWLDGDESWLARLLPKLSGEPPLAFEFRADPPLDSGAHSFLEAPWELLAGKTGFLAADPALDFAPLRRLGAAREPAPLSPYRLGLVFRAAFPRGANELRFEAEESAILAATGSLGLDLEVEESGNPGLLGDRLSQCTEMQVQHLSCHGTAEPRPVLALEDPEGNELDVSAQDLIDLLPPQRPRLLFLSACHTAERGAADSLAAAMIPAGVPAVLGWDGSVGDRDASDFARHLYQALARRNSLETAVARARRKLLEAGRENATQMNTGAASDRHLARLWLGPRGGGTIVEGDRDRQRPEREHGHKQFLDKRRNRSPVAGRDAFVGRRREIQKGPAIRAGTPNFRRAGRRPLAHRHPRRHRKDQGRQGRDRRSAPTLSRRTRPLRRAGRS